MTKRIKSFCVKCNKYQFLTKKFKCEDCGMLLKKKFDKELMSYSNDKESDKIKKT